MKQLWIRIERPEEVKEAQDFILHVLAEEGLTGEIPVVLSLANNKGLKMLSHIYDVSKEALISFYEKYGERNVEMRELDLNKTDLSESYQPDPLERIADALENIAGTLDDISNALESLNECIVPVQRGSFLRIGGHVSNE